MTLWVWIAVGVGGLLSLSLLVGFAIARILGTIGHEIERALEAEPWTSAPLTREHKTLAEVPRIAAEARPARRRSRSSQS
jgi:hypothetical protein